MVVLSGDIHYSSAVRLSFNDFTASQASILIQLVSSAIKNQELLTYALHTRLKQWLLPEKPRQWIGWSTPPNMVEKADYTSDMSSPPDWWCETRWIKRQKAQWSALETNMFWLTPPQSASALSKFVARLKFWRSRWFQEGAEAVGVNNIAVVHFHAQYTQPIEVVQDNYWFSTWLPVRVVRSRFQTKLEA